ncbi:TetR/AcrR family transcriptional regulator [Qaidamihabitans albus]|uniref:TetR/AcrR family transcriptional regulator n=1 Tax=Qaidamihabitans albus TaxID=2795733 RepID=UPI0018F20227|nr:TetR/AcrR family transcriptional regulator [Qaidamihabitans albus]
MTTSGQAAGKRRRTSARILECALELFERNGFESTTVAQIAAAAGVTEMTFFRHFPAKEQVLLDDPYDPLIAAAVADQPRTLRPLVRTVRGIRQAWSRLSEPESDLVRRRVRIVAESPALRAAAWRNNAETERLIVDQLVRDGTDRLRAHAAAGAALAALMAALFEWARHDDILLAGCIDIALDTVDSDDG